MVWGYLVNLVNVSSLCWQATFARRCLSLLYANDQTVVWMLRLTWFHQCACFGVEVHSLNMSSVMSRVSNGVGLWVSLAIDLSWRRTQGHHGGSRHQAVDACASDRHSGTARRRRGSGSEVCLCEMESERVVCVRATGPARVHLRFQAVVVFRVTLWSGRFRLNSRIRGGNGGSRHTRELVRSNESRATVESEKRVLVGLVTKASSAADTQA